MNRRNFLKNSAASSVASLIPFNFALANNNTSNVSDKVLVVLELSGGNDGLNTIVPYADDMYYKHRPNLGIQKEDLLIIDDHFGFNPGVVGLEHLYKEGKMAIFHGCGYENPSFSHFTSMSYMHTAAPNSGEEYGWLGRLADNMAPTSYKNLLINIDQSQSLAVRSKNHVPIVFDDPNRFQRQGTDIQKNLLDTIGVSDDQVPHNKTHEYLLQLSQGANDSSNLISKAWSNYERKVDYGITAVDLDKITALIESDFPARLYYTSFRDNAFDTHVHQANVHRRLLSYASDAIRGFMEDIDRIGKTNEVILLVMTEFGRRVPENTSLGTDHGAAGPMFIIGKNVKGGHYGKILDLKNGLDDGDNINFTTDFRSVYATAIDGWLNINSKTILKKQFETFDIFSGTV